MSGVGGGATPNNEHYDVINPNAQEIVRSVDDANDEIMILPEYDKRENIDGSQIPEYDADRNYERKLALLDEKYRERLSTLRKQLDEMKEKSKRIFCEYRTLEKSYERELRRIVREWANEKNV